VVAQCLCSIILSSSHQDRFRIVCQRGPAQWTIFLCHQTSQSATLERITTLRLRDSFSFAKEFIIECLVAMRNPSRFCTILPWKRRTNAQIVTNTVRILIFSYLILFSIFNNLYSDLPVPYHQPPSYDLENVTVTPVGCSFHISGYYEKTPRYIFYVLFVFTVVIRNCKWLAAGAAASVLTYSGVAAIHLITLFANNNNRLDLPKTKLHCESLPVPGEASFFACTGVDEPDIGLSMTIVSSAMLGALPMVVWSTTFWRSTGKAILIFWLLLLAVGHTFYPLIIADGNLHFQICPQNYTEPVPTTNFQAPFLDQSWRDSFSSLVSTAHQSSQATRNGSSPCIYSCFATPDYLGRQAQDITVWGGGVVKNIPSLPANRLGVIIFWWAYTFLAFTTLLTNEKSGLLRKWVYKLLSSVKSRQQLLSSRWKWKTVTDGTIKGAEDSNITNASSKSSSSKATTSVKIHTVLELVQLFTQIASVVAFCGDILVQETQDTHASNALSQESLSAVGQWGNIAAVLLVLVAAGIDRIWAGTEAGTTVTRGNGRLEEGIEDWDWRVGYAS
jgi:hypothetical protein